MVYKGFVICVGQIWESVVLSQPSPGTHTRHKELGILVSPGNKTRPFGEPCPVTEGSRREVGIQSIEPALGSIPDLYGAFWAYRSTTCADARILLRLCDDA